jgi:hypothetical protein
MTFRWLAIYVGKSGKPCAALLQTTTVGLLPYGVDEFDLQLPDYDGEPITFVQMPDDPSFTPDVVDNQDDVALAVPVLTLA